MSRPSLSGPLHSRPAPAVTGAPSATAAAASSPPPPGCAGAAGPAPRRLRLPCQDNSVGSSAQTRAAPEPKGEPAPGSPQESLQASHPTQVSSLGFGAFCVLPRVPHPPPPACFLPFKDATPVPFFISSRMPSPFTPFTLMPLNHRKLSFKILSSRIHEPHSRPGGAFLKEQLGNLLLVHLCLVDLVGILSKYQDTQGCPSIKAS